VKPRRDVHLALPVIALAIAGACGAARQPNPKLANQLIDVGVTYPDVQLDIRYATPDNFLGRAMYGAPRCYLVTDAAQRLAAADAAIHAEGLRLIVWDCYRPRSVQYAMWEILPDPTYVADPARGSRHNRGAAVDVGVVGLNGEPVPLPTDHDDFTPAAHRDAEDLPAAAIANRERLERVMVEAGWIPLASEWWHFDAPNWELYPLRDDPL